MKSCPLQGARLHNREALLLSLCGRSFKGGKTIVFFRTKQRAHRAKILFGLAGLPAAAELHGNMSQAARLQSLDQFREVCCSKPTLGNGLLFCDTWDFQLVTCPEGQDAVWLSQFPACGLRASRQNELTRPDRQTAVLQTSHT